MKAMVLSQPCNLEKRLTARPGGSADSFPRRNMKFWEWDPLAGSAMPEDEIRGGSLL
jgi:hypothetical protein